MSVTTSLDIEKAFDTVWLNGLIYKMIEIPSQVIRFLHSYLMNRKFRVFLNGITSREMTVTQGFPEGSILGPLLFTLHVHDIPKLPFTNLGMFADDTTISSSSRYPSVAFSRMQTHLNKLSDYFNKWKIKVNASKTEYMVCTRKRANNDELSLTYDDTVIRRVDKIKILGVLVDNKLTYAPHIERVIARTNDVIRRLQPLLKYNSGMSLTNKIFVYKVFIRSNLTYAINIWNTASQSNFKKIQIAQNKALRAIRNLRPHPITYRQVTNDAIHEMTEIETILEYTNRITLVFYQRMVNHANPLVKSLTSYRATSSNRRHPFDIISGSILNE